MLPKDTQVGKRVQDKKANKKSISRLQDEQCELVNHPKHYNDFAKETWEMMIDIWGEDKFVAFCEMNAFKYKMRAGSKPYEPAERDLEKAKWYIDKAKEFRG